METASGDDEPRLYDGGAGLWRYVLLFALAVLTLNMVWGGLGTIVYPLHVQQMAFAAVFTGADAGADLQALTLLKAQVAAGAVATPDQTRLLGLLARFDAARAEGLVLVATTGVVATMMMLPVVGTLSDRTRSRWGRRAPWILGGGVMTGVILVLMTQATAIWQLAALAGLIGVSTNMALAPLMASMADRVAASQIGTVSAVTSLGGVTGLIAGGMLGGALFANIGVWSYLAFAAVIPAAIAFVAGAPDRSSRDLVTPRLDAAGQLKGFVAALLDRDFRLVWISKVLIMFAYSAGTTFILYMLQSYIRPALDADEAARITPLLSLAALPGTLVAMAVCGRWSDRIGRRKPFVIGSSLLFAVALTVPLISPTLPALFAQAVLIGLALGCFMVVDQALMIDVLPDQRAAGRDLGMGILAINLGQALAPAVAGGIVSATGGYDLIFVTGVLTVLVATAVIVPVRRAR